MRKKLLAAFLCVSMAAGIVTGCGAKAEETVPENTGISEASVSQEEKNEETAAMKDGTGNEITLEVLSLKTEEGPQAAFEQMFEKYTAANPNITFEIQSMSSDDLKTTLRARSASGDMPDIITWMKEVEPEFMVDLTGEAFLDKLNADTVDGANAIYDNAKYAMPIDNGYIGLYYNKDVLKANGLEAPSTYEELVACCETLQKKRRDAFCRQSEQSFCAIHVFNRTVRGDCLWAES